MSRIRTIKPQFFSSPDTAKASRGARILYVAMWCWANDWGIGETNINGLLGLAFPDSDGVTREELLDMLAEIRDCYGVVFYSVRGRNYYAIPAWDDHQTTQRRASLKFPLENDPFSTPDLRIPKKLGISEHKQGNSKSGKGKGNITTQVSNQVTVVEGGVGGVCNGAELQTAPADAVARTPRGSRMPDGYMPTESTIQAMRQEFPGVSRQEWESEHRQFCDYWQSQSGAKATKVDWDATWRGWMRREFRKPQYERRSVGNGQRLSTVDQKIVNLQAMKEPE